MKNRREFIKSSALIGVFGMLHQWASAIPVADTHGDLLPLRQLTRDGQKVTAYSMGGWHFGNEKDPLVAERMVEIAMDMGVRFFDNARGYQRGGSEERMGKMLVPKYRDQIFLMTKAPAKTGEDVRNQLDESLKEEIVLLSKQVSDYDIEPHHFIRGGIQGCQQIGQKPGYIVIFFIKR